MKTTTQKRLINQTRWWIGFFMLGLVLSGMTAFPIQWGLSIIESLTNGLNSELSRWISRVAHGIGQTHENYPFVAYGTDWLGFAHIIIALFYIEVFRNPASGLHLVKVGLIACVAVIPLALIAGHVREIPFFWQLIDCSFGVFGSIPLIFCYRNIKRLNHLQNESPIEPV